MKKRFLLPIGAVSLIGFWLIFNPFSWSENKPYTWESTSKQEFFIETKKFGDFPQEAQIKKIWKITWSQDIKMNASVSGRVTNVLVKAGDNVVPGQRLVVLSDNLTNYWVNLDRSDNGVSRSQINYDSQKIALDKQVLDAEINLTKLEWNLLALGQTASQNIQRAQNDVDNVNPAKSGSKASLDLEKWEDTIARLQIQYDNLLVWDEQKLAWLDEDFQNFFNWYNLLLVDIWEFGDELFWASANRRNYNDRIEDFLWAKDVAFTELTKSELVDLLEVRNMSIFQNMLVKSKDEDISDEEILEGVEFVLDGYNSLENFLNNFETVLNQSIRSQWLFWEPEITALITRINGYQSQIQANNNALTTFTTNTNTFLNTYKANQLSTQKQIGLAEKDREILKESLENTVDNARITFESIVVSQSDNIRNLEAQIKNAQNQLENAKSNRGVSLSSALNSISDAQINYREAAKNYNKLVITAPVAGTISDVFVDVWQEVYSWNNVLNLVSNNKKEISVAFSKDEVGFVKIWDEVSLYSLGQTYTGSILSLSSVADSNLNYRATVWFDESVDLLWDLVTIYMTANNPYILFPINLVEVVKPGTGFIKSYSWSAVANLEVQLWSIWWDEIEIRTSLDAGLDIITNNVSNYDPNKFELKLK